MVRKKAAAEEEDEYGDPVEPEAEASEDASQPGPLAGYTATHIKEITDRATAYEAEFSATNPPDTLTQQEKETLRTICLNFAMKGYVPR